MMAHSEMSMNELEMSQAITKWRNSFAWGLPDDADASLIAPSICSAVSPFCTVHAPRWKALPRLGEQRRDHMHQMKESTGLGKGYPRS